MNRPAAADATRSIQAAILAWILPGAGHYYLGHRGIAAVFFVAISVPYWTGVAIGGVKDSVNPVANKWLFLAEMCSGGYTTTSYFASRRIESQLAALPAREREQQAIPFSSYYPESDVAQIYLATAGLLNLLAILDALARAQTNGAPTFPPKQTEGEAGLGEGRAG
jgi:hypothetical protein